MVAFSEFARKLDANHETLEAGRMDAMAVLALPAKYRGRLQTTEPWPEQHEAWLAGREHFGMAE